MHRCLSCEAFVQHKSLTKKFSCPACEGSTIYVSRGMFNTVQQISFLGFDFLAVSSEMQLFVDNNEMMLSLLRIDFHKVYEKEIFDRLTSRGWIYHVVAANSYKPRCSLIATEKAITSFRTELSLYEIIEILKDDLDTWSNELVTSRLIDKYHQDGWI